MADIKLTAEQRQVVENRGGTLLVSAAAGSGKTRVLIDRVLRRVSEEALNLDDFLLITFTQSAAAELRGKLLARLSEQLAEDPENRHLQRQMSRVYLTQISTVHAFCSTLLREYAHRLDIPTDFRICEEQEAATLRARAMQTLLEQIYPTLRQTPEIAAALDMLGAGRDDALLPKLVEEVYTSLQSHRDVQARLDELRRGLELADCTDVGRTVWGGYLIDELHAYLDGCIRSMEGAEACIARTPALENYAPTFEENVAMLRQLQALDDWEAVRLFPADFGSLKSIRKCGEPELQARVKAVRERVTKGVRERLKKFSLPSDEALADLTLCADALRGLLTLTERFAACYRAEKLRRHALDYNDLEHDTLRLLTAKDGRPTAAAREISGRFAEIMVDEYQDTNLVQDAIFRAISKDGKNLFFVGDVKQSIYRFRLADPTIFLRNYQSFADCADAKDGEPRKILLSDNFRSHPAILEAANDVFRLTMTERVGGLRYGEREALRAQKRMADIDGSAVELHCIDTDGLPQQPPVPRAQVEAEFVASRIEQMLSGGEAVPDGDTLRPVRADDIAILLRSFAGKAQYYLDALRRHGIRCVCGSSDLFAAEEIIILTALLQVIDNPHQDIPLLTVLFSPVLRFQAETLAQIRAEARTGDLLDALTESGQAAQFLRLLAELRDAAQTASLRGLLDTLDERLLLRATFGAMQNGEQRIRNYERFVALADGYESSGRYGLSGFLRYLEVLREKGLREDDAPAAGAVRLMTIHKSKGLEFPVVFLADLCKPFNTDDSKSRILVDPVLGIGAKAYDTENRLLYPTVASTAIADRIRKEDRSEEMRVLYVAMTRPQYRLIMTCCMAGLKQKLAAIARDLTLPADETQIESANSAAHWVLMTAMTHTEAGALFQAGGYPEQRRSVAYPWRITYQEAQYEPSAVEAEPDLQMFADSQPLAPAFFSYAHTAASAAPSKLTATQLKGRTLDSEISDDAAVRLPKPTFTKPRLRLGERALTPAERGTALHQAMQYIRYEVCTEPEGVEAELERLVAQRFLTPQQAAAVPAEKLLRFFRSEIGRRVREAKQLVREFKFSIFQDAALLSAELAGEQVLLQGVTDCCIVEADGLTILDFKTDRVSEAELPARTAYYRGQLDAYSRSLAKIFGLPVKERILYFFSVDTAVTVE